MELRIQNIELEVKQKTFSEKDIAQKLSDLLLDYKAKEELGVLPLWYTRSMIHLTRLKLMAARRLTGI